MRPFVVPLRSCLAAYVAAVGALLAPIHAAAVTPTLSTRFEHAVAVREDGTLWTWGSNAKNQIGDGTFDTRWIPWQVGSSTSWKVAATGANSTHAIRSDGTLWGWGENGWGQLGNGTTTAAASPVQIGTDTNWSTLAAGSTYVVAIRSDGTLWGWGANDNGQLGIGSTTATSTPIQVGTGTDWRRVWAGESHTVAIRTPDDLTPCGTLWAWGSNASGEVGDGTTTLRNAPVQVGTDSDWCVAAAGTTFTLAVKAGGTLWAWGRNSSGQLGDGTTTPRISPVQIGTGTNWSQVAAAVDNSLGRKTDGTLWSWGANIFGTLGTGTLSDSTSPVQVGSATAWSLVAAGARHSLATQSDGSLWSWGSESAGQMGDNGVRSRRSLPTQVAGASWSQLAPGSLHTLAIKGDGTLWGWGANSTGQIGDGSTVIRTAPVQVGTDTNWSQASASNSHSLAVRTDGTLWAWGANSFGQIGDGTTTNRTAPVQIGSDTNWVAVAAGGITLGDFTFSHSVALKSNGTIWTWGYNGQGQLGDGSTTDRSAPVQLGSLTTWSQITAGGRHTIARQSDGTVWGWGRNADGQLGDGSTTQRTSPVQVGTDTDWISVTAGLEHNVARKTNGSVWSWGANGRSQIDGTFAIKTSPFRIGLGVDWTGTAGALSYSLFLRSDGTAWAGGENLDGQFGNGSRVHSRPPFTQVALFSDWTQVRAFGSRSGGIRTNGTLWTWGSNDWGQLGIGVDTFSPANTSFSLLNGSAALTGANNSGMHDFGTVAVGNTANVSLTLTAGSTIAISSISAAAPFSVSHSCPATLNATNSCTITVTFSPSSVGSHSGSLNIAAGGPVSNSPLTLIGYAPSAPTITSASSTAFTVLQGNSFTVQTYGVPSPSLSLVGALPTGVTFTPATGVLQGTPASGTVGGYPVTISSSNAGGTTNQTFTLTVAKTNQAITWNPNPLPDKLQSDSPLSVSATAVLAPVTFTSSTGTVCTVTADGTTVTLLAGGTCTLVSQQAGNGDYNSVQLSRSFQVTDNVPPNTTITAAPAALANSSTVDFSFTSNEAGTFECKLDAGAFALCTSPKQYTSLAEGAHTFEVRAIDGAGNVDPTPASHAWTVDTIPPDTTITVAPATLVNDTTANFTFTSTEAGTFGCSLDGAAFTACTTPKQYTSLAQGSHTFAVRAIDGAGNVDASPASHTWTVDTVAPTTTITSAPATQSPSTTADFSFTATEAGLLECKLDTGSFTSCTSPKQYTSLSEGSHTFQVRATDAVGNTGTPASRTWTIDTTAPNTTITSAPSTLSASATADFSFTSTEPGLFECSLDWASFTSCTTPKQYTSLAEGSHTFAVRAIDGATNVDATPASHTWTVDTVVPDTTITSAPPVQAYSSTADFTFTSNDAAATFECKLDSGSFASCASPKQYTALSDGSHTFSVRAKDAATNVDATPAAHTWSVDTAAPTLSITSKPAITSANQAAYAIAGTCSENGRTVNAQIGPIATSGTCGTPSAGQYQTTGVDASALALGAVSLQVMMTDASGSSASVNDTTPKDTAGAALGLDMPDTITSGNRLAYGLSGRCVTGAGNVGYTLTSGASVNASVACTAAAFVVSGVDVSTLTDGTVGFSITQNAVNAGGGVLKDTANPVVTFDTPVPVNNANKAAYTFSGNCSENTRSVSVTVAGTVNATPTCTGGAWTTAGLDLTAIGDATLTVDAVHTQVVGKIATGHTTVLKDTATPAAPVVTAPSGTIFTNLPTVTGSSEANASIAVRIDGSPVGTASANGSGNWSFSLVSPLGAGAHTAGATATDAAGNASAASSVSNFYVAPTVTVAPATLPGGTVAVAYSQALTASGGTPPYTFAVTAGSLPGGLTLASGGGLAGSPTTAGAFNFTVTATDANGTNGPFTGSRAYTVTIARGSQSITFNATGTPRTFSPSGTFTVNPLASVSSGLSVVYTSTTPSVCTIPGPAPDTVSIVAAGNCIIAANQPGDGNYNAAAQQTQTTAIGKANQIITFTNPGQRTLVSPNVNLSASSTSGLTVAFATQTPSICSVTGSQATMLAVGTCTIRASQAGNGDYNAAANDDESFTVVLGATVPGAPTIGTGTPGNGLAMVAFAPPSSDGGSAVLDYRATCNPGGFSQVGTASPITVTGLANGTTYTCSVTARNSVGTGTASGTVSVTPRVLQIVFSPSSVTFGGQSMGTTSPATTVTVTNETAGPVTVSSITASAQFGQSNNCGTLAPLAACQVQVTFTPAASGIALGATAPVGGTLSVTSTAAGSPHTAPLSGTAEKSLVTHYYGSILRRAPDTGGKAFWTGEATRVANLGANVNEVWYSMAQTFYFSPEYAAFNRSNAGFVTDLYITFFNRAPDAGGLNFWVGNLDQGMPREVALAEFMFSTEFRNFAQAIFGSASVRAELGMVMDFYRGLLARLPDDGGFNFWVGRFRAAQCATNPSTAIVAEVEAISSAFALSGEYTARGRTSAQYVGDVYNAFLRRGGDLGGVQFWIGQVSSAAQTREQVRVQFKNSAEFQGRVTAVIQAGCLP